ncbi:MAG: addiction module protein [Gallionella sp.]|jgi:putative addiction module component (TIGR02574 family)
MKASMLMEEAVSLPVEERAYLVDCLLQSLNPPDATHVDAWTAVARRRLDEIRAGKVTPIAGETVFARIQQRFEIDFRLSPRGRGRIRGSSCIL